MARSFDIAVIGAGVIGLALARVLAREDARIAVIDAGAEIPAATRAAAGMLAPSFETGARENAAALYALGARSLERWPAFAAAVEAESGLSVDFRDDGVLGLAFDDGAADRLATRRAELVARGARADYLTGDAARRLEPALSPRVAAALYARDDAQVDAIRLLAALRAIVESRTGPIIAARCLRAVEESGGFLLTLSDGATVEAKRIVIASGAAAVAGLVGGLPAPPVFPVKGEAFALAMPEAFLRRVIRAPGAYLCPKAGGRLVVGASEIPHRDDLDVDDASIGALKRGAGEAAPAITALKEIGRWAGLRPGTPDGAPILGRDGRGPEGVYLALGHYRNGVLLAPQSARMLAEEIRSGAPVTESQPFRPERFPDGTPARRHG